MKKIVLLLISVLIITAVEAKKKKDPVVMTVVDKEILLSEFLYTAQKYNSVDFKDKKAVEEYLELFKNYKLKVADAEAMSYHKAPNFIEELGRYKKQLQESYLSDKSGEKAAMYAMYERSKVLPTFKQILFGFSTNKVLTADTVAVYNMAMDAYNRIKNGESFESVGESLTKEENNNVFYATVNHLHTFRIVKVLEDRVHSMEPGEVSMPFRSMGGFHIVKMEKKTPNPGTVRIAHIVSEFPLSEPTEEDIERTRRRADSIYQKAMSGEDFAELAKLYSNDTISGKRGGLLPEFGLGHRIDSFEEAAFALENVGDISKPVQTHLGFHVLKLMGKEPNISFEEEESRIDDLMKSSDYNFDLYREFDQKMKERHGYILYPEAYAELERLADDYFPGDTAFLNRALKMQKPLIRLDTMDFDQDLFAEYMYLKKLSNKTYSHDFMKENFDLFVRLIITDMEREVLERDYPEYNMVINEYYDGTLLHELNRQRIYLHPKEEQEALEIEWVKELNEKYPVKMNKKVIKKIRKYIN